MVHWTSVCISFISILCLVLGTNNKELQLAEKVIEDTLKSILERWEVSRYQAFLNTVTMTHTSWEVLKLKFENKILASLLGAAGTKFVISFLGSSVTAGHDSPFNRSFPIMAGERMKSAFGALGLTLETRNAAMGNNPCLPYDVCIRPFAGSDADIVHWEQTFNCGGDDARHVVAFEQFIRQSLVLPSRPVVVFAHSSSPNWKSEDCKNPSHEPKASDSEKRSFDLILKDPLKVVAEINHNPSNTNPWNAVANIFRSYKTGGIQMWNHGHYEKYKCHGPYNENWGCCSAAWHPSLLGHELRGDHFAFFWLLILRDAVRSVAGSKDSLEDQLTRVVKHIDSEHKHVPEEPLHSSPYIDAIQCFTTYEPRADPSTNLRDLIIPSGDGRQPFQIAIMEDLSDPGIVRRARVQGYLDYKYAFCGNKENSPLSIKMAVTRTGTGHLCQVPGVWGKMPNGYNHFWKIGTKVYLTENVADFSNFVFSADKATLLEYLNRRPQDTQTICVDFTKPFPKGQHVLTIVPTTDEKIMISYVMFP